ncbi:MAG: tRNA (N6-isopentenyl adenosine(37)-C2)-methylthiotransferase MiaB [Rhodobacteraceae bacterium]|nr:tRNA (N6-isopentenyl adenosine(37)-C2)-methylthiotransferase MiaB [Paracoccaceae bacterium]
MSEAGKKLFIKTYGCQMNTYDSERMTSVLAGQGYSPAESVEDADLVLLNTCHIREKAAEKVYSELGRLRHLKTGNPDLRIGVAGCVAQAEGREILARADLVDLVVGPQAYHRLPQMLEAVADGGRPVETDFPTEDKFDHLPETTGPRRAPSAFLTVQEGCDKFCAFCVVPYTRGAEVSRPAARIEAEARRLVASGVVEVTLLGQNVNAYRDQDDVTLAALVSRLARIEGLERIRYTTSHPNDMCGDLIAAHAAEPKLMPYLHLPVQAGSDRILRAMNRKHTAAEYLDLLGRIRAARPDIALSGDFIVGFPGETEEDFQATLDLVRVVEYAHAFSFAYSARPGTPAAGRAEVDADVKAERLYRLQALLQEQQTRFLHSMIGRTLPVLLEKPGRNPGQLAGKSPYLNAVHLAAGPEHLGRIVQVRIAGASTNSLSGELAA